MQGGTLEESTVIKKVRQSSVESKCTNGTNFGEEQVDEPIQEPTEDFVTHEDSDIQVTDGQSTRILCGVWPFTSDRKAESSEVDDKYNGEETPS
jgi:hypothetical protein